jgi:hypothetical protein
MTTDKVLEAQFNKVVAEMYCALKYTTEELRAHRNDDRGLSIISDSLAVLKEFETRYLTDEAKIVVSSSKYNYEAIAEEKQNQAPTGSGCYSEGIISTD